MAGVMGGLLSFFSTAFKDARFGARLTSLKGLEKIGGSVEESFKEFGKIGEKAREHFKQNGILSVISAPATLASHIIGRTLGHAVGIPLATVTAAGSLVGRGLHHIGKEWGGYKLLGMTGTQLAKGAWWTTKTGAKGVAMEGLKAGQLAYGTGKFLWKMRHNTGFQVLAGSSLIGGAFAYGAMRGERNAFAGEMLPYDAFEATFTNPQEIHNPMFADVPGQRGAIHKIDDFGATGDLVFAMNNLRNKGMF